MRSITAPRFSAAIGLCISVLVIVAGCKPACENRFQHDVCKFAICFPSAPEVHASPAGFTLKYGFLASGKNADETYMVSCSRIPEEMIATPAQAKELVQLMKQNSLKDIGAQGVATESDSDMNGQPATYFEAKGESTFLSYKIFLVGSRLYEVGILSTKQAADAGVVEDFINSFEALP